MKSTVHILVVGTLPPPLGGASVLVKQLVEGVEASAEARLTVVNTNAIRGSGWKAPFRLLESLLAFRRGANAADVLTLHISGTRGTSPAFLIMGTAAVLAKRWTKKPLVIRTFANRYLSESQSGLAQKWTTAIIKKADLFLVETQESVRRAKRDALAPTEWFPNVRPLPLSPLADRSASSCRRFVYLGHVRPQKGMPQLMEAMGRLPEEVSLDVYGTFWDGMEEADFAGSRLVYRGSLEPENVVKTLANYDALVLPTLYDSEGYPGVILEAYMAGIPVIASRVGGIPEIVDEHSGVLIEKGNVGELADAMNQWVSDPALYQRACSAVVEQRIQFSSERWTQTFIGWCRELAQSG